MPAYAVAHLHNPTLHEDVFEYLERIQGTLDPFGGRFLVHGGEADLLEGEWPGTLVVIEFPGIDEARTWYRSPAYQAILRMRTDHIVSDAFLIEGVEPDHSSAEMAARLRELVTS